MNGFKRTEGKNITVLSIANTKHELGRHNVPCDINPDGSVLEC